MSSETYLSPQSYQPINVENINAVSELIKNTRDYGAALAAYEAAISRHPGNIHIINVINAFITRASEENDFEHTAKAYNEAQKSGLANGSTYARYINAAGHADRFEEATKALSEAQKYSLDNAVTYSSYINAARNCKKFTAAKQAFETVRKKGIADMAVYNSYVDILILQG